MVADRLGLWRLSEFELTRLASPIDVHLFRAVGSTRPDDRRLIALSDVRELSVLCDERRPDPGAAAAGARPRLPAWTPCAPPGPPIRPTPGSTGTECSCTSGRWWTCRSTSWTSVIRTLAPRTEGLGLEQAAVAFRTPGPDGQPRRPRAADVPAAGRRAVGAGHRAADRTAAGARRLRAERDPGPPPGRGLPVRAGADAAAQPRPGRPARRRSPSTTSTTGTRPTPGPGRPAARAATPRTSCWARSPPRPSATRRA